ncbi:MAG: nucleotidyltransferase domain-containing protein [Planctomycetota bacterium]
MPVLTPQQLEDTLADVVSRLRAALAPTAIYLFGSYVYGEPHSASDLDFLVVVPDSPLNPYERDALAYRALGGRCMPMDVQVYTQAEFEQRAALPVSFERTVKMKGRLLYAA